MKSRQAGFSLAEVLVSLVILGIISSSIFYFLQGQGTATSHGTDLSKATFLGKRKLDSLRVMNYNNLVTGSDTVTGHYIRRWFVTANNVLDRKSITLYVDWPLSAKHSMSFYTVVGDDQHKL